MQSAHVLRVHMEGCRQQKYENNTDNVTAPLKQIFFGLYEQFQLQ